MTIANSSPPSRMIVSERRKSPHPPGGDGEQRVARRVAQGIVDLLEAVEVGHHEQAAAAVAPAGRRRIAEPLREHGAVQEAGQRVVPGEEPDRRFRTLQFGDIYLGADGYDRRRKAGAGAFALHRTSWQVFRMPDQRMVLSRICSSKPRSTMPASTGLPARRSSTIRTERRPVS